MTDLEKLKEVFDDIGVKYLVQDSKELGADTMLQLDNGIGYSNFVSEFYFKGGYFVGRGVWEQ